MLGSMLAGDDAIEDTVVVCGGATSELLDVTRAPWTIGTWLRAFRWHNVRQLGAVSRELLARVWSPGGGATESPRPG